MGEIDPARVILALTVLVAAVVGVTGALYLGARREDGFFLYFPYAVLLSVGVLVLTSGRSLSLAYELQSEPLASSNTVSVWTTRLTSVLLVLASLERTAHYVLGRNQNGTPPYSLLVAFATFWSTTVAFPALLGWRGSFSHDYLYALLMGFAALLCSLDESNGAVATARNALFIFLAASIAFIPLQPSLVLDSSYSGGVLPHVPRFAGLAPHSVSLGMLAQLGLLCLYARPLSRPWLNRSCWALGLVTLFAAQSKVSWLSFPLCVACMFWMRRESGRWHRMGLLAVLFASVSLGLIFIFGNLGPSVDSFLSSQQGTQLASLSGRDQIWSVALREWARHPVFGYGSGLFDDAYRASIGMPFAFNAHNQFIDTLARSGLVGVIGLLLYGTALLVLSVRYAHATGGLSLALFLAIALRSVSEVPLMLVGYGPEILEHLLLLAILAGNARSHPVPFTRNAVPQPL